MGEILNNFIWLYFAHFIGDIALQQEWQANNKGKYWYVMLSHSSIWAACISIALLIMGKFALWKALFLIIGHFAIDTIKAKQPKTPDTWWMIYPDQFAHFCQLLIVYFLP